MNGFLIIDKPAGVTSFDIVRKVRRWCQTRRVGHAGTLDPMATGVLPVAIGKSTRLIEYLMADDKSYQAVMMLGAATDTQDVEGQVLEEKDWQEVTENSLQSIIGGFVGHQEQVPPMYSALKKDGQPLYKLARQGIEVERKARRIIIDSLVIDEIRLPFVTFTVTCSKGTYIRTLCHDIGQRLGCGAHMTALKRLRCGPFNLADSQTLQALQVLSEKGHPLPLLTPAEALLDWVAVSVDGPVLQRLYNGVAPHIAELKNADIIAGARVKFLNGADLVALAHYLPGDAGKKSGDFELLKVFPPE